MSHSRRRTPPAGGTRSAAKVIFAALAVLALTAGLLLTSRFRQPGARRPGSSSAAGPPGVPAASPGPADSPARPRHGDPFAAAAVSRVIVRDGTIVASVYDVHTGQSWQLGRGRPQAEASIVKLDILETLLAEQRAGSTGPPASDSSLAQQMIEESDNNAATSLWDAVGGPHEIRSFNQSAGLTDTSPSRCVACPGFPWPGWGLTTTTPADQIVLLRQLIAPGPLLTYRQRSYVLRLMEHVTPSQRWGVSGGIPLRTTVALKNGWLPLNDTDSDWQVNSVGWISGHGRDYLIAVLTTGNPTEQYGIDTIDQLAGIVWRQMR